MLRIENLSINVSEKTVINNFNLNVSNKEIHVIMGQNGIGKSTILRTIMGEDKYVITNGKIFFNDEDITNMEPYLRAQKGLYGILQNPTEIEGVSNAQMLRTAINAIKNTNVSIFEFNKKMGLICDELKLPRSFIHRNVNEGMSGGEKKKNEMLHLWMLEPTCILLDEIDSGLDIDSIHVVGNSLRKYFDTHDCSIIIVTHQLSLLDLLKPTHVHVIKDGKIFESGNYDLAKKIIKNGFDETFDISQSGNYE